MKNNFYKGEQKMKEYTSKELNEIIGYKDISGQNNSKNQVMTRCINAGLIVESIETKRGLPNKYIIIEDNFHLDGEEWVDCYCNEDWEVSNYGRIRRKSTKKLMGNIDLTSGYKRITLIDKATGKQQTKMIHRLVYFSFHPELIKDEEYLQIDHINGIRTDNNLTNLQPLSNIQNTQKRDGCQEKIRLITTDLIIKYGYEKVEEKLQSLLTNGL